MPESIEKKLQQISEAVAKLANRAHGGNRTGTVTYIVSYVKNPVPDDSEMCQYKNEVQELKHNFIERETENDEEKQAKTNAEKKWQEEYGELEKKANNLALATTIYPSFIALDKKIKKALNLSKIDEYVNEYKQIESTFKQTEQYFLTTSNARESRNKEKVNSLMTLLAEVLNKMLGTQELNDPNDDKTSLNNIRIQYINYQQQINKALKENKLPSIEELSQLKNDIINEFSVPKYLVIAETNEARYHPYKIAMVKQHQALVKQRKDKLESKKQEAENEIKELKNIKEQFETAINEATGRRQNGKLFDNSPPTRLSLNQLLNQLQTVKEKFKDWPCTNEVLDVDLASLRNKYNEFINEAVKVYKDKIDMAKENKQHYDEVKKLTKNYIFLLNQQAFTDENEIDTCRWQLFKYTHQQFRKNQWFSCFRHSYWDSGEKMPEWKSLVNHAQGQTEGFSGKRSFKVLKALGFMDKSKDTIQDELATFSPAPSS